MNRERIPDPNGATEKLGKFMELTRHDSALSATGKPWWTVRARDGTALGTIDWFEDWRKYVFNPNEGTCYDSLCMGELERFLARIDKEEK